jgi:hypothetical protein
MASNDRGSRVTSHRPLVWGIAVAAVAIVAAVGFLVVHRPAAAVTSVDATGTSTPAVPPATVASPSPSTAVVPTTTAPVVVTTTTPTDPTTTPTDPTTTVPPGPPHFDTPQAAMVYLAAAWNTDDSVDLDHVTTPAGRADLAAMRNEAVDLRLDHCTGRPQGDYLCYFDHGSRSSTATAVTTAANPMVVLVGPARTPGWYMTVFISCG